MGALEEHDYVAKLRAAAFIDVDVEAWRVYRVDDARAFLTESGVDVDRLAPAVDGRLTVCWCLIAALCFRTLFTGGHL